jgi:hypothetical protein
MKPMRIPEANTQQCLAVAAALIGWPTENRDQWLEREACRRATELRALGASDAQAAEYSAAWRYLVSRLIEMSRHQA